MGRMNHILLVYPRVPHNTYWSYHYALKFVGKKSAFPPLGLLTVAALLPTDRELKIVDMNVESLTDAHLRWADAVFVSAMIVQKESLAKVARLCREWDRPLVAGGPYPTVSHREIPRVDHFVLGEVEDGLAQVLSDLDRGVARYVYSPAGRPDLRTSVVPRFDLLDLKAYSCMSIQYSRGCPFHCEFCDIWKLYGNRPRLKSAAGVLAELEALYRLGWRGAVFFVDDNFIGNRRRVREELLPALIDWQHRRGFPFRFLTEASINLAQDKALLTGMRRAGFNEVFIGIETPSAAALRETGKLQNLKTDIRSAVGTIQRRGLEVMAGFILGFDNDTEDIFQRQIDFIQQTAIPKAMVGLLSALPGTELYRRLQAEGRLTGESHGNNTHCGCTNFRTRMDPEHLQAGYQYVLASLYDRNLKNYFQRCRRMLENLGPSPLFGRQVRWRDMPILFRSLSRQPFTPYGLQYLRFISGTIMRHRRYFSEAVRMSIVGHHFFTITRETLKAEALAAELERRYRRVVAELKRYRRWDAGYRKQIAPSVKALWTKQHRELKRLRRRIRTVHIDFRADLIRRYREVEDRILKLLPGAAAPAPVPFGGAHR